MSFLDGLSSALTAGTQGAAGYLEGQDKGRLEAQARARQIALDLLAKRKQQEEETMGAASRANLLQDNQLNALKAGYFPVGQLRQEAAQTGGIANTGAAGLSGAANIGSGGIDLSALQPFVAKLAGSRSADLKQGSENPVTLGGQSMGFDYNRSLEGRQLQKMQDLQTMKDVEAQRKQTEAASLAAGVADRRNRAAHGTLVQDFKHTQPYSPDTDYAAALIDARGLRQINSAAPKGSYQQDKNDNFIWLPAGGGKPVNYGVQGNKKGASKQTSAQTMMALTRVRQFASDLDRFDPSMTEMENPESPLNLTQVGIPMKVKGTVAGQQPSIETPHGMWDMFGNAVSSGAQGVAQNSLNSDPLGAKYRTYTTGGKTLGLGLAEMLPRPNNALVGMEQSLSTADVGAANPEQTKLVQERRRSAGLGAKAILSMNPEFVASMQEQDPGWISKVIKTTIETGKVPKLPTEAFEGGGNAPAGKTPSYEDWLASKKKEQ